MDDKSPREKQLEQELRKYKNAHQLNSEVDNITEAAILKDSKIADIMPALLNKLLDFIPASFAAVRCFDESLACSYHQTSEQAESENLLDLFDQAHTGSGITDKSTWLSHAINVDGSFYGLAYIEFNGLLSDEQIDEYSMYLNLWVEEIDNFISSRVQMGIKISAYLGVLSINKNLDSTSSLQKVSVAILDSGIDAGHSDLANRVENNFIYTEAGFKDKGSSESTDILGHGTAVASIVTRIASNAVISSYKILDQNNKGSGLIFLAALKAAIESDASVINISAAISEKYKNEVFELLTYAYNKNKLVVTSVRNNPLFDLGYPAEFSHCISVNLGDKAVGKSNIYQTVEEGPIDIIVPVESVLIAMSGKSSQRGDSVRGTSFVAPMIAAYVTVIFGIHGELRPYEVKTILKNSEGLMG